MSNELEQISFLYIYMWLKNRTFKGHDFFEFIIFVFGGIRVGQESWNWNENISLFKLFMYL